jgi:uncharacterized membrane protein
MKTVLAIFFAVLLLAGGFMHIKSPAFYHNFVPSFIPFTLANVLATVAELAIGVLLLIPKYREWGALGFMLLMVAFLPIHVWDALKETPAIGSKQVAFIRIAIQMVLIFGGWWLWKRS